MRKFLSLFFAILSLFALFACSPDSHNGGDRPYAGAPKIVLDGVDYFAADPVILDAPPEGYAYAGELTEAEKADAHINGSRYYIREGAETVDDLYVYQECGTMVGEDEVDNARRQWAYVKWSRET